MNDYEIFELGDFALQDGATLRGAKLAYKTHGRLNEERSNAIVYPTWYSGRHWENEWLIGEGMALDPNEYFIIVPNMLGNGLSSSPSNTPPPYDSALFPHVRFQDNVRAQHRLVTEVFGIERLALLTGWSMGAGQTYQWAMSYPEMVPKIAPFCGSAKTSEHNIVFLEGVKAALTADAAWNHGWYDEQPTRGLRAAARVYISATPGFEGGYDEALASIEAQAIVMPAEKDLYFPPEDEEYAVARMKNAELRVIPGVWGHFAGGGANPTD